MVNTKPENPIGDKKDNCTDQNRQISSKCSITTTNATVEKDVVEDKTVTM